MTRLCARRVAGHSRARARLGLPCRENEVVLRAVFVAAVVALIPVPSFAQTAPTPPLGTLAGHEINFGVGGYKYQEPGDFTISISGAKFSGEYTGVIQFDQQRNWFAKANARISFGKGNYNGWCAPWLITPDSTSPNGYALDLGDYSPCTDEGNSDWYFETRGLVGKDFIGRSWSWSPEVGLGVRYISSGLSGIGGFRTDTYLYIPLGITARTNIGSHGLAINAEYDLWLRGWQNTYETKLGGGQVPATPTAPAFTIEGISDLAFEQHSGWGLRLSAKYDITRRLSVEPYFNYWRVADSPISAAVATFTVNGSTVGQQFGAVARLYTTTEAGIKLGFRF